MLHFTKDALQFLQQKIFGIVGATDKDAINVSVQQSSVDVAQGESYHTTVLALPADKDWTVFASDPTRMVTM